MKNNFFGKDIITIGHLTTEDIELLFSETRRITTLVQRGEASTLLRGNIMAALFYEPSSRTFGSFIAAMQRLGGSVIPLNDMSHLSIAKGETFEDTIGTFSAYADVLVIRHPDAGSLRIAASCASVPVINAGDGIGEHPTQALLDVFTITNHFPDISKLKITIVGDFLYGRTVHSLVQLLTRFHPREIRLVSSNELRLPRKYINQSMKETDDLEAVLQDTDVLYMTRIQKERFSDPQLYARLRNNFSLNVNMMAKLKKSAILMHPFPRVGEISPEIDTDSRALYLREQIPNGLYVRMALLLLILKEDI